MPHPTQRSDLPERDTSATGGSSHAAGSALESTPFDRNAAAALPFELRSPAPRAARSDSRDGGNSGTLPQRIASATRQVLHEPLLRGWFLPTVLTLAAIFILIRYDGPLDQWLTATRFPGDVKRELQAWQQFGQGVSIVVIMLVIFRLDLAQRYRLLDFGVALALVGILASAAKVLIGRPRPKYADPERFLGPLGMYPVQRSDGSLILAHAWDAGKGISSDLWSMPSSHTAFAAALCVFLSILYPRIKWIALALLCVVAAGRMLFDAHYLTDVIAGGVPGWLIAGAAVRGAWGVKLARRVGILKFPSAPRPPPPSL
ncbi:hypothetical protein BH11PLA1_BH11PLA1_23920 [soil metagenome]